MQVVHELAPTIAAIISGHCPGTGAREEFVKACVKSDWAEVREMVEGMLAEPWHLCARSEGQYGATDGQQRRVRCTDALGQQRKNYRSDQDADNPFEDNHVLLRCEPSWWRPPAAACRRGGCRQPGIRALRRLTCRPCLRRPEGILPVRGSRGTQPLPSAFSLQNSTPRVFGIPDNMAQGRWSWRTPM